MRTPILLWGLSGDSPLDAVFGALENLEADLFFVDQRRILESQISLHIDREVRGCLQVGARAVDLTSVAGVYLRPYDTRKLPALRDAQPGQQAWQHALGFDDAILSWLEISEALVVNRPSAMAPNNAKPLQLNAIRAAGFSVPETLVTTDAAAALEFRERHRAVVYKSISGMRSIVHRFDDSRLERLADLAACPTQFQQFVPGLEHRVHVVGDEIFACTIRSEADDYRYSTADAGVDIRPCALPAEIAERCVRMVAGMQLHLAGIDMRRTPSGEWFCFEVNPSPAFTYYEEATGQPIADAVAGLLSGAHHPSPLMRETAGLS